MKRELRVAGGYPGSQIAFMTRGAAGDTPFVVGVSESVAANRSRGELEDRLIAFAERVQDEARWNPDALATFGFAPDTNHDGIMSRHFSTFDAKDLLGS
jgi:hypothetical protein